MGFGILTVGYYLTYLVGMIWKDEIWGLLLLLSGCFVIAAALRRLSEYEATFRNALVFDLLMLLPAAYRTLGWLSDHLLWDLPIFGKTVLQIAEYAELLIFFAFGLTLLLSIRKLAVDVDDLRIVTSATRNLVFLGIYTVLWFLSSLPTPVRGVFALMAMLVQIVYLILMGVMLVSCYMRICDEGDEEMPLPKSRFAWVNKLREERARREQRAADSVTEYAERKLKRQKEERERYFSEQNAKKKRRK